MFQDKINQNVDSLYKWQINETTHQNSRVSWALAVHALLFGGLCTILNNESVQGCFFVIPLIILIGIFLSVSSLYSVRVGELATGTVYEKWDAYHHQNMKEKCKPIPHVISLAPTTIMRSKLNFLLFYTFAPNVFCAAWLVLLPMFFGWFGINKNVVRFVICFVGILALLCLLGHFFKKFLLYQWSYYDRKEEMERNKNKCLTSDRDAIVADSSSCCSQKHISNCNQVNIINGECCMEACSVSCPVTVNTPKGPCGENLFVYHLMIDRFNGNWTQTPNNTNAFLGGNIKGITQRLDYIAGLGCNAIMLTPLYKSNGYHGYHVTDFNHVDPHFGTWQDFAELVKKTHEKGMKVICDFVPNHCHVSNILFQQALNDEKSEYRKWFYFDESRKGNFVSYQNYPDLPKFNLYHAPAADYLICIASQLVKYGVDGLRIDHAIGVPFSFLKELRKRLKLLNPNLLVFGEVWGSQPRDVMQIEFKTSCRKEEMLSRAECLQENMQLDYVDALDGVLDFKFRDIILEEIAAGHRILGNANLRKRVEEHFALYPSDFTLLLFLDNHDTDRIMRFCNGDRSLVDEAVTFMRSLPYPSIIYYGSERYFTNNPSIFNGDDDADLRVRPPFDWN